MRTSDTTNELAAALAKAQGAMHAAAKDATNPHFGKSYATLASVWEACREPLSANGLSVVQPVEQDEHGVIVATRLMHASGQWCESSLSMPIEKRTAQSVGSAITYGRRYGLAAMVGVCPDDDDDGNAAEDAAPQRQPQGTRTAKADHAKKLAAEHGMKTADQLPALTEAEQAYVIDVTKEIAAEAAREDKQVAEANLEAIAAFLKDKSEPVRKAVGPLWLKTMKVVNPNWKMKKETAE